LIATEIGSIEEVPALNVNLLELNLARMSIDALIADRNG
jgi:hypothetical protein